MTNTHTPGPWKAQPFDMNSCRVTPADNQFFSIAAVSGFNLAEAQANARLIAAAPALLAACQGMVEAFTAGTAEQHVHRVAALDAIALTQKEEA